MSTDLPTRDWAPWELSLLEHTPLIRVAGLRADGALSHPVVIGHVRLGHDEFIRSLNGLNGKWYQVATRSGRGEIEVGGTRIAVAFIRDTGREAEVDRALRARYGNDSGVRRMTSPTARRATLRMVPLA